MTRENLKSARQQLGLSQNGLAAALGTTGRQIRRYEVGDRPIPLAFTLAVSLLLERAKGEK